MDLNELEEALRRRQRGQLRERAALIGCLVLVVAVALLAWLGWRG